MNDSVIMKLSQDQSTTLYSLPQEEASSTYFEAFGVTRDGHLWILAHVNTGKDLIVYRFESNSGGPDKTRLSVPQGFIPDNFVVLANGHILVNGYFENRATEPQSSKSYFAEFDPFGRLVKDSSEDASKELVENVKAHTADAGAAEAEDGRIYLLEGDHILILSAAGEQIRRFSVPTAGEGYLAGNVYTAG